jgi:hypothetical protein
MVWLADRGRHLHQTTQADIDTRHTDRPDPRRLHAFLNWAMQGGHMPRLVLPPAPRKDRPPISQDRRLAHAGS